MVTLGTRTFRAVRENPTPPAWFGGTWPEFLCYRELTRQGYEPGLDFDFQSSLLGGRQSLGGLVADFVFDRPAGLVINVNSRYWHYQRPQKGGVTQGRRDVYAEAQLASLRYTLIWIDDDDLLADAQYYVSEALDFRDHSELS